MIFWLIHPNNHHYEHAGFEANQAPMIKVVRVQGGWLRNNPKKHNQAKKNHCESRAFHCRNDGGIDGFIRFGFSEQGIGSQKLSQTHNGSEDKNYPSQGREKMFPIVH